MKSGWNEFGILAILTFALFPAMLAGQEKKQPPNSAPGETEKSQPRPGIDELTPIGRRGESDEAGKQGYWFIDAEKAMTAARKENRSLIINFTGSDWCGWCIKLEGEVFSRREFSREALKEFVFLKLDFPSDKSKQSTAEIEQNEKWKSRFGVSGFPSIYICDTTGRPFAKTGYQAGGPLKYLAHVKAFREKLVERNEIFALAAQQKGDKKAELLDRALALMDPDIATGHYEEVIKEIVSIDKTNKLGLRSKYYATQDAEERRRILAKIDVIVNTLDPDRALAEFEKAIENVTLPANSRIDALQQKLFLLRKLEKIAAADQLLDDMVIVDGLTEERRERLLIQKAFNYIATERMEDAMKFLDDKIQTYPSSHVLVSTKGEILDNLSRHEEAVETFDKALALADGSEAIAEITALKAYSLVALDRTSDALELFQSYVDQEVHPDYAKADLLVQKAILLLEVDRAAAAELAGKQALELAESDEQKREIEEILREFK
ncbi:MAG: thioredoxin family protein [Planctomycetota bacterium]|nr:thioredoxin family protein [Planctomycetota bacterium]